jgi:hypothetical protein
MGNASARPRTLSLDNDAPGASPISTAPAPVSILLIKYLILEILCFKALEFSVNTIVFVLNLDIKNPFKVEEKQFFDPEKDPRQQLQEALEPFKRRLSRDAAPAPPPQLAALQDCLKKNAPLVCQDQFHAFSQHNL